MMQSVKTAFRLSLWTSVSLLLSSCAVLHKVQLSDVEARRGRQSPVSVRVSETTVDLKEISDIAGALGRSSKSNTLKSGSDALNTYTTLFQFGPRTGTPVYNEYYARLIPEMLAAECKGGRLSNIVSVRETRSYPVVKGEIIRIDAICTKP